MKKKEKHHPVLILGILVSLVLVFIVVLTITAPGGYLDPSNKPKEENFQFQKLMYAPTTTTSIIDPSLISSYNAIDIMTVIAIMTIFFMIITFSRYSQPEPLTSKHK